jgi:uncharacterized protein (TIGR00730 family)
MKICVFAASSDHLAPCFTEAAEELGRLLGQDGHTLIFGGGRTGLMGACARGAAEHGAEIIGIAPRFFDEPGVLYERCSRFVWTETMAERKTAMEEAADAFLVLPGGIGTMEEFFEVLTLRQLGLHAKPIALLNTAAYFDGLAAFLQGMTEQGFAGREVPALVSLCGTPEEALRALTDAPQTQAQRRSKTEYFR